MGFTAREKQGRANRRARSVKPETGQSQRDHGNSSNNNDDDINGNATAGKSVTESGLGPMNYPLGPTGSAQIPNPNPNNNQAFDDKGWGYCTEEQLEALLMKNLDSLYKEAISKLMALGYDEEVSLNAILRNGHCYGGMDVLTNIVQNSLSYLNSCNSVGSDEPDQLFANVRKLEEYSLASMVCLLQQLKPHLSKGDAMWCLLMSDLHIGRACVMEIPVLPPDSGNSNASGIGSVSSGAVSSNMEGVNSGPVGVPPALYRFDSGWGFGNGGTSDFPLNGLSNASEMALQREIVFPKRFNLTPAMKNLLKRNVAAFAAGYRANAKQLQSQSQACASSLSDPDSSGVSGFGVESHVGHSEELQNFKNQEAVNSILSKFRDLNLEENAEHGSLDKKDEVILTVIHQIKDLEGQLKERKEWAHQKAIQAATKLSNDLTELKMLKMEREETQRLKMGKPTPEDSTMKRLSDMENALRKASAQVDNSNASVRKLESENAEIQAEIEASKLSASESEKARLEIEKRHKKHLKRSLAWEKQKSKLQEDVAKENQKISDLQHQLVEIDAAQKEAEAKWRQEQKAKELSHGQVEEEQRLLEAAEAGQKRRLEALRLKVELDFQRLKDDMQRLEHELSRLKASQSAEQQHQPTNAGNLWDMIAQGDSMAGLQHEFDKLESSSEKEAFCKWDCILCKKDQISVVFLPCAHQVLCASCNESYEKTGKAKCPSCQIPIELRVRVFGTTS